MKPASDELTTELAAVDPVRANPLAALDSTDPKSRRVIWCLVEMCEGRWVPGWSHTEGAELHKVSPRTIGNDAEEASRMIRLLTVADDQLKDLCVAALQRAMRMASDAGGAKGSEALSKAVAVMANLKGFDAPKKVSVDAGGTLADFLRIGTQPDDKEPTK